MIRSGPPRPERGRGIPTDRGGTLTAPLAVALIDAGLSTHASTLAGMATPCARMRAETAADADIPLGASKLGGAPDLPQGFEWPSWGGAPLAFLGQVNLRDLAALPSVGSRLPTRGLLSFFYEPEQMAWGFDPKHGGSGRVLWSRDDAALERAVLPAGLPDLGRFGSARTEFREHLSLPPYSAIAVRALGLSRDEEEAYVGFCAQWDESAGGGPMHQLLGHPTPIQDEMQLEVQMVANGIYMGDPSGYDDPRRALLEPGATDWHLLAQVDSDEELGMMWGDLGMLYFWIRSADLADARFDRTWVILQCS